MPPEWSHLLLDVAERGITHEAPPIMSHKKMKIYTVNNECSVRNNSSVIVVCNYWYKKLGQGNLIWNLIFEYLMSRFENNCFSDLNV